MLHFIKTALNHLTGQAYIKNIIDPIVGGAASAVVGSMLGGGKSSSGSRVVNDFNANTGMFNVDWDKRKGSDPLTISMLGDSANIYNDSLRQAGLFSGMQAPQFDLINQMGSNFLGQLQGFDPMSVGQQQYNIMNPILQQGQEQAQLDLENRLFAQGRLGGTGGALQQNALFDSHQDANRKLLFDSYGLGLQAQDRLYNMGTGLSQMAPQLQGLYSNLGSSYLQNALSMDQAGLNAAQVVGGLKGAGMVGQTSPSLTQQFGAGLMTSGLDQISTGVQGLFNPIPASQYGQGGYQGLGIGNPSSYTP